MILILILIINLFLIGYQNTKHCFSQKNKDFSNFPKFFIFMILILILIIHLFKNTLSDFLKRIKVF